MDVLVVSGCTGDKVFDEAPISCNETDSSSRADLIRKYPEYVASASEMYTGEEHEYVRRAVENLRDHANATWQIVSAGYGLLDEDDEIVAYDCTLSDIDSVKRRVMQAGGDSEDITHDEARAVVGQSTNMVKDLLNTFVAGYELVFIVLSEPYYAALASALHDIPKGVTVVAIASKRSLKHLGGAFWAPATRDVRTALGLNNFRLRGELLERASANVSKSDLMRMSREPDTILEVVLAFQNAQLD